MWRRRVPEQPGPLSPRAEAAVAALEQVLARVVEDPQVGRRHPPGTALRASSVCRAAGSGEGCSGTP